MIEIPHHKTAQYPQGHISHRQSYTIFTQRWGKGCSWYRSLVCIIQVDYNLKKAIKGGSLLILTGILLDSFNRFLYTRLPPAIYKHTFTHSSITSIVHGHLILVRVPPLPTPPTPCNLTCTAHESELHGKTTTLLSTVYKQLMNTTMPFTRRKGCGFLATGSEKWCDLHYYPWTIHYSITAVKSLNCSTVKDRRHIEHQYRCHYQWCQF